MNTRGVRLLAATHFTQTKYEFLAENIVIVRRYAERFGKELNKYTDKRDRVCGFTISESK